MSVYYVTVVTCIFKHFHELELALVIFREITVRKGNHSISTENRLHVTDKEVKTMATTSVQKAEDGKFLYFCYASNLLKSRFHLYVPSAEFVSPAKLEGYRLNFRIYPGWSLETSQWRGSLCSIEQDPKSHVWGAIWRLDKSDVERLYPTLYRYSSPEVTVTTPEGQVYICHTYHMAPDLEGAKEEPPSPHYMKVMIEGAIESKLPESYVDYLRTIKDNGDTTPPPVMDQIYKK